MKFKRLIVNLTHVCWSTAFLCGAANAAPAEIASAISDITTIMTEAENLGSWPAGYCRTTYSNIAEKSHSAINVVRKFHENKELADNLYQLNEQAKGMLALCEPFERNAFPGGQLQTRYLRADMSLWKAQFDMLLKENPIPIEKVKISRADGVYPPKKLKDFDVFSDCKAFYCSEMVVLPEGNYMIGGTDQEHVDLKVDGYRAEWESPRHNVQIRKPFAISKTEVTVEDFAQFVKETNRKIAAGCLVFPGYPAMGDPEYTMYKKNLSWENPGFRQEKNSPVTCVTRKDAEDYAIWLSAKTGAKYRLPSEAEWEYAARAGTNTPYFWGNKIEDGCNYAAIYDLSTDKATGYRFVTAQCDDKTSYTAKVASFKPNNWGIHDITGNAREWVADAWEDSYKTGPYTEEARKGGVSQFPVLRGGAWNYMPQNERIAYRSSYYSWPIRSYMWGFRLVREISD